jgi:UDP-glucose 4-epimerase
VRKVLVTGGNGFIGRYVAAELHRRGSEVWVFDRRHAVPGSASVLGDVRDASSVVEAVAGVDGVIHLAGVLGTQETIVNPVPAAETNILGALNVLQACAQHGVPLVNIGVGNHFEDNTYSLTKSCVERFCRTYGRYRGLPVQTVRAYNAYGPRQSVPQPHGSSRVRKIIPSFITRAFAGEPIQIYGDGSQVMDMVYVADVASALVAALVHTTEEGYREDAWNAGTGRPTTVRDIAEAVQAEVERQTGKLAPVEYLPMRPGETPGGTVLAPQDCMAPLGVASPVTLEAGLVTTVTYYKNAYRRVLR